MTDKEKKRTQLLTWLKNLVTKNVALKVVAVLFALLLWGYVLTDQNPVRTKIVSDITTSFDGEAELIAMGLCVRGDRNAILQDATVSVRTQITNYAYVNASAINATISLKNISEPRTYELPIQATINSTLGVVQTVSPASVTVEIDSMVTKTIPVTTSFTGELPSGYWADTEAMTSTTRLDITGAKTDISNVTRAECIIDLTDRTTTIYSTFDIVFYDKNGEVVSSDIIIGTLPSSTVRLPIYSVKTVPIDIEGSLVGADDLAANHEMVNAVATPASVRLVGDQAVLDGISSITLDPITVSGLNATTTVEADVIVPEGVRLLDTAPVSVVIEIREIVIKQPFDDLELEIVGATPKMRVTTDVTSVDLTIEGRYSLVSLIKRGDISLQVDVTGLSAGTHKVPIFVFVRDEAVTVELTTTLSVAEANVYITLLS